jgi:hypothetical protein
MRAAIGRSGFTVTRLADDERLTPRTSREVAEAAARNREIAEQRVRAVVVRAREDGTLGPRSAWNAHDPASDEDWASFRYPGR